jgi:hypothetical protein
VQERAEALAEQAGDPKLRAVVLAFGCGRNYVVGDFEGFLRDVDAAERALIEAHPNPYWELGTLRLFRQMCLYYAGRWRDLRDSARVARERADPMRSFLLGIQFGWMPYLLDDDPAAAQAFLDEIVPLEARLRVRWAHSPPDWARAHFYLYEGRTLDAYRALRAADARTGRSPMMRLAVFRARWQSMRVNVFARALASGALSSWQALWLRRRIAADLAALESNPLPLGPALADLMRSLLAPVSSESLARLVASEDAARAVGLRAFAVVAQRRRGERLPGDEGRALVAAADAALSAEGARAPERLGALLLPP